MKKIAIVTSRESCELDGDLQPLIAALAAEGLEGVPAIWDDPTVKWEACALALVRSTWDYVSRRDVFVAWAEQTASKTRLENPASILRWNTDKRYLRDLQAKGVPIVETHWIPPGERPEWPFEGEIVVKPTVSAGSMDTDRYGRTKRPEAEAHVRRLHSTGRTAMVQPFVASIESRGETGLVFIDGAFSHAIHKGSMLQGEATIVGGLFKAETISLREPTAAERDVAQRALACSPCDLLYARDDVVESPDGIQVLELEATEPSLHLRLAPGSAARLAGGVARRVTHGLAREQKQSPVSS